MADLTSDRVCVVCVKPATMRCSGCAQPSYCGRACQKCVWSTHKWFCKQDEVGRRTFSFPPLTADEAKHFKPRGNGATPATRSIVEETGVEDWHLAIYRAGWTKPPVLNETARNTLLAALQKPKDECPVAEPERSYILALLNQLLLMHDQQTNPEFDSEALDDPGTAAFQMCGLDLSEVVRGAYRCNGLGPDFWSRHNDFFQAILMFHCIGLAKNIPGPDRAAFTHATSRRISALANAMDAEPALKEVFELCALQCAKTAERTACIVM